MSTNARTGAADSDSALATEAGATPTTADANVAVTPKAEVGAGDVASPAATPTQAPGTQQEPGAAANGATTEVSPQPPADSPGSAMELHVQSNLHLLDMVVTDHDRPVHGLDRSRFHIL